MCSVGLGLAAFTSLVQSSQQKSAARRTNTFNRQQAENVRAEAEDAARARYKGIIARRVETREAAAAQARQIAREAARASGIARLEGAGASLGSILTDLTLQEVQARVALDRQGNFGDTQDVAEFGATASQALGRAKSALRPRVIAPGFLQTAVSFLSTAASFGEFDNFGKFGDTVGSTASSNTLAGPPLANGNFFSSTGST